VTPPFTRLRKMGDEVRIISDFDSKNNGRIGTIRQVVQAFGPIVYIVDFPKNPCCPKADVAGTFPEHKVMDAALKVGDRVRTAVDGKLNGASGTVERIRTDGAFVLFDGQSTSTYHHGSWLVVQRPLPQKIEVGDTVRITQEFKITNISPYGDVGTPFGHFSQEFLRNHGAVITDKAPLPYIPKVGEKFTVEHCGPYVAVYVDALVVAFTNGQPHDLAAIMKIAETNFRPA